MRRSTAAFGLIIIPSAVLFWAEPDWLIAGLMGLITIGMLIGVRGEGGR